jgi:NADH-quinone oxidoreductase subunit H
MVDALVKLGLSPDFATFLAAALGVVVVSTFGLLWVIFGIWLERKFAGRVQDRLGPNRTGPFGLFQTFADVGKLLIKEDITPEGADRFVYNAAPLMAVGAVLLIWAVVPFSHEWIGSDVNVGALYFVAAGSFATLAILLAGWGSNNKYALLGAFRVIAALVSYEIPMVLAILIPVLLAGTMSMQGIVQGQSIWYIFTVPVSALIFFTSSLAEIGRSPFDLIEAESEIIAGFNIEYSGMKFAMFYAGEFLHAFTVSVLVAVLFLGGWRGPGATIVGVVGSLLGFVYLFIKTMLVYFVIMLIRNTVPRVRIDHMMAFNWKFLVPLSLINVLVVAGVAKLYPVYTNAVNLAIDKGGLVGTLYSFGPGIVAGFPRAVALLIANLALIFITSQVLHQFVRLEQRKTKKPAAVTTESAGPVESAPASAGR